MQSRSIKKYVGTSPYVPRKCKETRKAEQSEQGLQEGEAERMERALLFNLNKSFKKPPEGQQEQ